MTAGWPRAWSGCWNSAAGAYISRRLNRHHFCVRRRLYRHDSTGPPLPPAVVTTQGRQPPGHLERIASGQAGDDATHQAAEQERLPGRPQAVLEPVPVRGKFEVTRPIAQYPGADAIGRVIDRHHGERIDDIGAGNADCDI